MHWIRFPTLICNVKCSFYKNENENYEFIKNFKRDNKDFVIKQIDELEMNKNLDSLSIMFNYNYI